MIRFVLLAALVVACAPPTAPEEIAAAETVEETGHPEKPDNHSEAEPEETPEGFQADDGAVYILSADDAVFREATPTAEEWDDVVSLYRYAASIYNETKTRPGPYPYRMVKGARP